MGAALLKHWGHEFKSPVPKRKLNLLGCACNPSTVGHRDRQIPRAYWLTSLARKSALDSGRDPVNGVRKEK